MNSLALKQFWLPRSSFSVLCCHKGHKLRMTEDIFVAFPIVFTAEINYWETAKTQAVMDNDLKKDVWKVLSEKLGYSYCIPCFSYIREKLPWQRRHSVRIHRESFPTELAKMCFLFSSQKAVVHHSDQSDFPYNDCIQTNSKIFCHCAPKN